jgi:hypothetical protein
MRPDRENAAVEIVVARYREAVSWLRNTPPRFAVTIYDKGGSLEPLPGTRIERLENAGFEAHSYLHHITSNYDRLSPLTVFCQGHPFDHAHDLHPFLRSLDRGETVVPGFHWLGFIIDSDDPRGHRLFVPWSKNKDQRELFLDEFYARLLDEPAPAWTHFYVGAQFAVSRAQIRKRPLAFYQRALELSLTFPDAGSCLERVWDRVFLAHGVDPALLGGQQCRYLKPIRRLAQLKSAVAPAVRVHAVGSQASPEASIRERSFPGTRKSFSLL